MVFFCYFVCRGFGRIYIFIDSPLDLLVSTLIFSLFLFSTLFMILKTNIHYITVSLYRRYSLHSWKCFARCYTALFFISFFIIYLVLCACTSAVVFGIAYASVFTMNCKRRRRILRRRVLRGNPFVSSE